MPPAAKMGDKALHDSPHCHAPIHPAAPTPTPLAHPPVPLDIVLMTSPTVMIAGQPAVTVGSQTKPCILPSCSPAGPGMVAKGSMSVLIDGKPAARVGDMVAFTTCVAPIPSPKGKILPPGAPTVIIGG
jgi:uncharacterized Zn-binding protein involved in type VI secretion